MSDRKEYCIDGWMFLNKHPTMSVHGKKKKKKSTGTQLLHTVHFYLSLFWFVGRAGLGGGGVGMNGLAQVPHTDSFPFIIILIYCWGFGGGGGGLGMNWLAQVPHPDSFVFIITTLVDIFLKKW